MKRLVIWAHSECRSNAALYAAVRRLAESRGLAVTMCLWDVRPVPDERKGPQTFEWIRVGDDLGKGRAVLAETGGPGSVHVFCVYQNSSVWRRLIVEAKRGGARVVVNAEAPCEMCLGAKALLKRLYYRWILPGRVRRAVRAADLFLSASGVFGKDRLMRLGWPVWKIVPFGYASPRLPEPSLQPPTLNPQPPTSLRIVHLGSEAPYRGVSVAIRAARKAGVELIRTGGRLPRAELVETLRRADLAVGCGLCEPWGMRINDALLEGVPVVVSDGMGVAWAVERYGCGLVVPKGDVGALAKVFERFRDDADFRARLRSGARRAAVEMLPEARAQEWLDAVSGEVENDGVSDDMTNPLTVAGLWEEHCLECAMPACYGACALFERGWHGRCVRVDGFEESIRGTGTVRFRRWGKIELMHHGRMVDLRSAGLIEKLNHALRPLWRLMGMRHRALRWRLVAACGRTGSPNVWRLRLRSARDERLAAAIAYGDGREVWREAIELRAGIDGTFEWRLPSVGTGALFRLFPPDGEATDWIQVKENLITTFQPSTPNPQPSTPNPQPSNLKCVAWDLDGVIWDGTLGEGESVRLRPGVMEAIRALDEVGIVSSLCSKNDAGEALAKLTELGIGEWFVFPQINWGPKSESLRNLAEEMNIGLDAIAFVDDRAENRAEVKVNCPGVRIWDERDCFEKSRAEVETCRKENSGGGLGPRRRLKYREEMARRKAARKFAGDSAAFASASGLEFELLPVEGERIDRCRELVQRTNQLNLTGRRYDAAAFAALLAETSAYAVRAWDRYGDYGIIGFVALKGTHVVECCFSCRSAGRGIERRVLAELAHGERLTADIVETERNEPIRKIIMEFL